MSTHAPDQDGDRGERRPENADAARPTREDDVARVASAAQVRRAPRYRAFVLVGVVLGVLSALVVVPALASAESTAAQGPVVLFVGLALGAAGAVLGAVVAVLLDRSRR